MSEHLAIAQRSALLAAHQFLAAAQAAPVDSDTRRDCVGAAEDIMLALDAYRHLWNPMVV